MTENNDPPISSTPDSDDDWDDVVFDDTEVPLDGAPRKKSGKVVKYAGLLAVLVALGAGGFYWMETQSGPAPVTPATLAAMQPSPQVDPMNDPMAQPAPLDDMPADGGEAPIEVVENIDLNSLIDPADDMGMPAPEGEVMGDEADFPPMPESDMSADGDMDVSGIDVTDVESGEDIGIVAAPDTQSPPMDPAMADPVMPVDAPSMPDEIADNDAMIETQTAMMVDADNAAQDEIDQKLEEELIASLTSNTADNAPVSADDSLAAEEALINSMDQAIQDGIPAQLGDTSRIEANAYVRPTPEKYYIIRPETAPVELNRELMTAKRALNEGRNGRALEMFNALYEANPNDTRVMLGRSVALQRLGRYTEAISLYEQVLRENPENLEALTNMLGILSVQNPAYSVDKLQRLHASYPANAGVKVQLALAYGAMNYPREAIALLTSAQNLEPTNPTIAYNLAVMHDRVGDRVNAAMYYRRSLMLERDSGYRGAIPVEAIQNRLALIHQ